MERIDRSGSEGSSEILGKNILDSHSCFSAAAPILCKSVVVVSMKVITTGSGL